MAKKDQANNAFVLPCPSRGSGWQRFVILSLWNHHMFFFYLKKRTQKRKP